MARNTNGPRASEQRKPLSEARVVEASIAIADAGGTSALTMRSVADSLGVQAMSLYNHVANKDALLDLMVDAVFGAMVLPTGEDWQTAMHTRAHAMYEALRAHPWAIGLLDSRRTPGARTLLHHDATIGVLRKAGFSVKAVSSSLAVLDAYVYGFVIQELSLPISSGDEAPELAREVLEAIPTDALPNLAWLAAEQMRAASYDFADEFEHGLRLVLEGLARDVRGSDARARGGAK